MHSNNVQHWCTGYESVRVQYPSASQCVRIRMLPPSTNLSAAYFRVKCVTYSLYSGKLIPLGKWLIQHFGARVAGIPGYAKSLKSLDFFQVLSKSWQCTTKCKCYLILLYMRAKPYPTISSLLHCSIFLPLQALTWVFYISAIASCQNEFQVNATFTMWEMFTLFTTAQCNVIGWLENTLH